MTAEQPETEIVADKTNSLREETASSTQSLSSSIVDYRRENGRTYHRYKDGKYNLPNDELEQQRALAERALDLQHHLFLLTFDDSLGRLFTYTAHFVCANCNHQEFFIDDIDEEWNHSAPFDYIHSRMMTSSIGNWPEYLKKIYDNLNPGGYVELQEADLFLSSDDGTLQPTQALPRCLQLMYEASVKLGHPYQEIPPLKDVLAATGFVDVVETRRRWPINT
ncbi:hypothetical protein LCI18_004392 [Fusarium solani-melongenae]|uniref:Uncharacterized protein n=1 Tax=Fusarium solani subsp. cucurbitae TaxID=2747967 RepID=A0ACD3YX66_FUSSC|nr:hypothetical protein LCI18_004392 [Fusarium solani-melongenae]